MPNPYRPTISEKSAVDQIAIRPRRRDWLCWTAALIPLASVYFTWIVAWYVLGYQPRPSLDDPSQVGPLVSVTYLLSGLALVSAPVIAILGPAMQLASAGVSLVPRLVYAATTFLIIAGTVFVFRWDPLCVMSWFMD